MVYSYIYTCKMKSRELERKMKSEIRHIFYIRRMILATLKNSYTKVEINLKETQIIIK